MGGQDQPTSLLRTAAKQQRDMLHAGYLDGLESSMATKKGHPGRVGLILMHHTHNSVEGLWSAINVELDNQFDTSFDAEDIFAPPRQ